MNPVADRLYRLPIVGDALCYIAGLAVRLLMVAIALLSRMRRLKFGTTIVWVPKGQGQTIVSSMELLQSRDSTMFRRLTREQHLTIYYAYTESLIDPGDRIFGMHKRFVELGPEAVACFMVQCLFLSAAAPRMNQSKLSSEERVAVKDVSRKMAEWLTEHSFNPGLIEPYRRIVEKRRLDAR